MTTETILGICGLVAALFTGLGLGLYTIILPKRRAEQNIERLLKDVPAREEVAEQILQNPNSENIQKGRELVISVLESMSQRDRREISSAVFQDSIRGRAWYVAKLVTGGRSNDILRIPSDERVIW